jgi:hypothetical protein
VQGENCFRLDVKDYIKQDFLLTFFSKYFILKSFIDVNIYVCMCIKDRDMNRNVEKIT